VAPLSSSHPVATSTYHRSARRRPAWLFFFLLLSGPHSPRPSRVADPFVTVLAKVLPCATEPHHLLPLVPRLLPSRAPTPGLPSLRCACCGCRSPSPGAQSPLRRAVAARAHHTRAAAALGFARAWPCAAPAPPAPRAWGRSPSACPAPSSCRLGLLLARLPPLGSAPRWLARPLAEPCAPFCACAARTPG
jgi:hypothetical protein